MWMTHDFEGASIIVADDDPTNLQVLEYMLGGLGCEVRLTRSGEMLLKSVAFKQPDLILLDVHMPGLDGYQTCNKLKANEKYKNIPVIFVSAMNEEFSKVKGFKSGAVDYITKPFQLEELKAHIGVHLRLAKQANELRNLQAAVEQSRTSILITDLHGIIEYANQSTAEISGYSMPEIVGHNPRVFKSDIHPNSVYQDLWQTISQGKVWNGELCNRKKDGSLFWELVVISPVRGADGSFSRYVAVKEDVTTQRELREQLIRAKEQAEAANQAKSSFLAMMSHEIRTPMNGVIGMIDLLDQSHLDNAQKRLTRIAKVSSMSLLHIINDILDFSKIEAGRMKLESIPVDWRHIIDDVAEMVSSALLDKGLQLYCFVSPEVPDRVKGDQARLRQVLLNLLSNAIKFTHNSDDKFGQIFVCLSLDRFKSNQLILEVEDNGIGISPTMLENLFQPFVQADNSTHRRYGGTGLGLSICNRLISLMEGSISCASLEGVGSTFTVKLPCDTVSDRHNRPLPLKNCLIHLFSDQNFIYEFLKLDLEGLGAKVMIADTLGNNQHDEQQVSLFAGTWSHEEKVDLLHNYQVKNPNIPCVLLASPNEQTKIDNCVLVDGNPFRPLAIQKGVNIALGRESSAPEDMVPINLATPTPTRESAETMGKLILVAEDNLVNQEVIQLQLQLLGYIADVVANGREAIEKMKQHNYGLLLTDCHMPKMDGFELTSAIRQMELKGKTRLPIIAVTANAMQGEAQRCLIAGMDGYLAKPVELTKLKQLLEHWLPTNSSVEISKSPKFPTAESNNHVDKLEVDIIDKNLLHKYLGDDLQIHHRYLRQFANDSLSLFTSVKDNAQQGKWSEIAILMHKLKSSSKAVGAATLSDLCTQLEQAAKTGNVNEINRLLADVNDAYELVRQYINKLPNERS